MRIAKKAYILFLKPNFHCYEAVQHEFEFKFKISVDREKFTIFCDFKLSKKSLFDTVIPISHLWRKVGAGIH